MVRVSQLVEGPHLGVLQLLMAAVQGLLCSAQLLVEPVLRPLGPMQLLPDCHELGLHDMSTGGSGAGGATTHKLQAAAQSEPWAELQQRCGGNHTEATCILHVLQASTNRCPQPRYTHGVSHREAVRGTWGLLRCMAPCCCARRVADQVATLL